MLRRRLGLLVSLLALGAAGLSALTEKEVVAGQAPKVVYIKTEAGSGTGFFINSYGYALTCNHVVEGAKDIKVKGPSGFVSARILEAYPEWDQAILDTGLRGTPYAPLASAARLEIMAQRTAI